MFRGKGITVVTFVNLQIVASHEVGTAYFTVYFKQMHNISKIVIQVFGQNLSTIQNDTIYLGSFWNYRIVLSSNMPE